MKQILVVLAIFVAAVLASNPKPEVPNFQDIKAEEKEAIQEAVRMLSMQTLFEPKERTEILKQLISGEIDFEEALAKVRSAGGGDPSLNLDPKYRSKLDEISGRLKHRRGAVREDLLREREQMRQRRKERNEM